MLHKRAPLIQIEIQFCQLPVVVKFPDKIYPATLIQSLVEKILPNDHQQGQQIRCYCKVEASARHQLKFVEQLDLLTKMQCLKNKNISLIFIILKEIQKEKVVTLVRSFNS